MNRKLLSVAAVAAGITALATLGTSSASADPTDGTFRVFAGSGSDTTQSVMNGLAEAVSITGNKQLASYDAIPVPTTVQTRAGAAGSACTTIQRPSGSGDGRKALINSINGTAGTYAQATANLNSANLLGCFDFARSSSLDTTTVGLTAGGTLTYVPFASENVAYATLSTSNVPRQLTKGQLKSIYQCTYHGVGLAQTIQPLLPQDSSGTRQFFVKAILGGDGKQVIPAAGAGGAVVEGTSTNLGSCVKNKAADGVTDILEHDGTFLNNFDQLVPFSTAQFIAQQGGFIDNNLGRAALGSISVSASTTSGGVNTATEPYTSTLYNNPSSGAASSALKRDVYNVVQTSRITGANAASDLAKVFVGDTGAGTTGNNSLICAQQAVIQSYGFNPSTSCGVGVVTLP
jgi:hypothetical protein